MTELFTTLNEWKQFINSVQEIQQWALIFLNNYQILLSLLSPNRPHKLKLKKNLSKAMKDGKSDDRLLLLKPLCSLYQMIILASRPIIYHFLFENYSIPNYALEHYERYQSNCSTWFLNLFIIDLLLCTGQMSKHLKRHDLLIYLGI